jgi:hypothetical protein
VVAPGTELPAPVVTRPETPASSLAAAFEKAETVGAVWTAEGTGYSVRYALRSDLPGGGQRVVIATDGRIGARNLSTKPADANQTDYAFTVIEFHLNAKGVGEGKASLATKIAVDPAAKTIALDGYAASPVVLKTVKRTSGT